jgi:hypothetical protein
MATAYKKKETSIHLEFAEKSQLLRWFHERDIKELKAMRKGFLAVQAAKKGATK